MFSSMKMMIRLLVRTEKVQAFCKGKNSYSISQELVSLLRNNHQVCVFHKGTPHEEESLRTNQVTLLTWWK